MIQNTLHPVQSDLMMPKKNKRIGVMAPSSSVRREDIEKSVKTLEHKGYSVFVHPQTFEHDGQMAGNMLQKSLAFQGLWQRDDIDIIWAAGGGNRAMQLLETINFKRLKDKPKTLVGFSDVTALLNGIYAHTGIPAIHGPVFKNLHTYNQCDALLEVIKTSSFTMPLDKADIVQNGEAEGTLIGGNLSVFQYLPQILPGKFYKNSILCLEDCTEELSKIDRMFMGLKLSGIFDAVNAIVLGEFTNLTDSGRPFGFTFAQIVHEHLSHLDIPIIMQAPFGHGESLYPMIIGTRCKLSTSAQTLSNLL
jgi:muramoyltetrapeptide carboxypeptidase